MWWIIAVLMPLTSLPGNSGAGPARVEFTFRLAHTVENPFSRAVWASVEKPSGSRIRLPAFFVGGDRYTVRVLADQVGEHHLVSVEEERGDSLAGHPVVAAGPESITIRRPAGMKFVRVDPQNPYDFADDDGRRFVPIGGNIHANESMHTGRKMGLVEYYQARFRQFAEAGLNWTRIWMIYWSRLNLDWLPEEEPQQPKPGWIDATVAESWDRIIETAEENGVYVQVVLQNHGQYSTETNPKWSLNPWNSTQENGFLDRPADFFTSERARRLTKQKYRYIVARWGYSPAVFAWELFNEVHWVDAIRYDFNEAAVAAWHDEMASYLRSIDTYGHLITTSMENISSPVYAEMDYLQPHIYGVDMLASVRYIDPVYNSIEKPAFFGEFGDDHMPLTDEEKRGGISIIPPIWAGIMGSLHLPPQTWFIHRLIETGHLGRLAAVSRFLDATKIAERGDLIPFSPPIKSDDRMPHVVTPGFVWMNRPNLVVDVTVDGSSPANLALAPGVLVADSTGIVRGFAREVTYRLDFPEPSTVALRLRLGERPTAGTNARVMLDGKVVADHSWRLTQARSVQKRAVELSIAVPSGRHEMVVRNQPPEKASGPDARRADAYGAEPHWFYVDELETGYSVPRLAAAGKRADDFVALWIWNRDGVFSLQPVPGSRSTLLIEDLEEGSWQAEWWDTDLGLTSAEHIIEHRGGTLALPTPIVERHTAVVLTR